MTSLETFIFTNQTRLKNERKRKDFFHRIELLGKNFPILLAEHNLTKHQRIRRKYHEKKRQLNVRLINFSAMHNFDFALNTHQNKVSLESVIDFDLDNKFLLRVCMCQFSSLNYCHNQSLLYRSPSLKAKWFVKKLKPRLKVIFNLKKIY